MSEKNQLQEYCQKNKCELPEYSVEEQGPAHAKKYRRDITTLTDQKGFVFVAGKRYAADEYASSKKEAERLAASKALEQILASKQTASTPESPRIVVSSSVSLAVYVQQLHEYLQKVKMKSPQYMIEEVEGSESHNPKFEGTLSIQIPDPQGQQKTVSLTFEVKEGYSSKKEVQQYLAQKAMLQLREMQEKILQERAAAKKIPVSVADTIHPVPKTTSPPRKYQIEIYQEAMKRNLICCLPTGAGKTLIACLVIKRMKECNPKKKILFLVDRIPLVFQQAAVIDSETGLRALTACGDTFDPSQLGRHHDVLVVIAPLYINMLRAGLASLEENSLIVVDEAHHITKDHAFAVILRDYYSKIKEALRPKVLGLTASPAGEKTFFGTVLKLKILTTTGHAEPFAPLQHAHELAQYVTTQGVRFLELPMSRIEQFLQDFLQKASDFAGYTSQSVPSSPRSVTSSSPVTPRSKSTEEDVLEGEDIVFDPSKLEKKFTELQLTENTSKNPLETLVNTVRVILDKLMQFGVLLDANNHQISDIHTYLTNELNKLPYNSARDALMNFVQTQIVSLLETRLDICKAIRLLQLLTEYHQKLAFRALVFVQTRETAALMEQFLKQNCTGALEFVKPTMIIGHSSKGTDGMSIAKQKKAVDEFKSGKANLLVATSVVEEGFNVPECNLVIRLDAPSTITALVQSRGRLRHSDSEFIAIVKSSEKNSYEFLLKQEEHLKAAVTFLQTGELPSDPKVIEDIVISDDAPPKSAQQKIEEMCQKATSNDFIMSLDWAETATGPSHSPVFTVQLRININPVAFAEGKTKKEAKENAAKIALKEHVVLKALAELKCTF